MAKRKLYSFDNHPEHRAQLDSWAQRWIDNALSCEPMSDEDRAVMVEAIHGMYDAAGLARPLNVVFVPSPLVLRLAGGFAAGIWYLREHAALDATEATTLDATLDATLAATLATTDATLDATDATLTATRIATRATLDAAATEATLEATEAATLAATRIATLAATEATLTATRIATLATTLAATRAALAATRAATEATTDAIAAATRFLLECATKAWRMWNGGNQWSGWVAYLSFFRHIAGLDLPEYERWKHYEAAAVHGGPRIMHEKFAMVSDRPEFIHRDAQNRPHCATGPFTRWRDGWAIYAWHGTLLLPMNKGKKIIEEPETITVADILAEENVEVRRVMIERAGERFIAEAGLALIDECDDPGNAPHHLRLYDLPAEHQLYDPPVRLLHCVNGTPERSGLLPEFVLTVPATIDSALAAAAWTYDLEPDTYALIERRT